MQICPKWINFFHFSTLQFSWSRVSGECSMTLQCIQRPLRQPRHVQYTKPLFLQAHFDPGSKFEAYLQNDPFANRTIRCFFWEFGFVLHHSGMIVWSLFRCHVEMDRRRRRHRRRVCNLPKISQKYVPAFQPYRDVWSVESNMSHL
jgi:hypothetical protein